MHLLSSIIVICVYRYMFGWGLSRGSDGKESAYNAGDLGLIPGLGRSSGEEDSYPFLGRKSMTNLDSILKSRDIANKSPFNQGYGFSSSHVWM